ncbi:hypothetical protein E4O05_00600 [Treponema sp. OMZ 787]|uniref:FlgO family outer membrane protein n=1 Tax=Treponema sp. OMZ 787 TaxID=2563669 RepID=UPI0020A3ACF1|nr:FlgO family outer membrane protein [Treponema sp. OMZ 787]UTC62450.1 hypothetical protein E4O05_00600 [Treponema sp. OMZ 787]
MKKIILSVVLVLLVGRVYAQTKPVVVVAPFDTKGVAQDEAEVVTELFTAEYANTGSANVVDRNSFDKIKTQLSFQSSDWSNADKVAQLGKALNANHVVVGQLLKFRSQIAVTIKIIDVNTTTILASYTEKVRDIENLLDKLPEICTKLSSKVGGDQAKQYKIGDEGPGGGIVFYIKDEYIYEVIFLDKFAYYEDAELIAKNYTAGGYEDWYFPTNDEMRYICYNICNKRKDLWGKYWVVDLERYGLACLLHNEKYFSKKEGEKRGFVGFYGDCTDVYTWGDGFKDDRFKVCLVRGFKQQ